MSDNQLCEILDKALEDKKELERKGRSAGEIIRRDHNYDHLIEEFNELTYQFIIGYHHKSA